ncbi:MAG TPA: hypothetical protein VEY12_02650 [Thermoplasmata archaeon]|nr:hypothetical protein [Thermoplasmata archaeon]
MEEIRLGAATLSLFPAVRGLPSDGEAVREAIAALEPDVVALSVSPEELDSLRAYPGGNLEPETTEDEAYVAGLSAWEEPVMPPPCFTQAARIAEARHIPLEALDLSEEAYTEAYTKSVSTVELLLQGRLENRLLKKRFRVATPREFAIAWDAEINRTAGFARLQKERERFIASRIREVAGGRGRVLAVVEVERVKGVLAALRG